ncbi:MAG: hypothetical protein HYT30_01920 [Parcubacteria group bacterium]|nr:hypothetical protein [Parcubacteria group bacterium]
MDALKLVGAWVTFLLPTIMFGALWFAVWPPAWTATFWQGFGFGVLSCVYIATQTTLLLFGKQSKYL